MDADLDRRLLRFRNLSKKEDAGALARDLFSVDRTRDAMEVAATGLRRRPDDVALVVVLGRVLLEGGDLERAQEAFLQASRMNRTSSEALHYLGQTLLRRGDPKRAAKVLGRASSLGGYNAETDRLRERANRLARGLPVSPDSELDATSTEEAQRLQSDAPPHPTDSDRPRRQSSHPPRSRTKTLMLSSDTPSAPPPVSESSRETKFGNAADESEPPDAERPSSIQSSPSIRVGETETRMRPRRQATPHGVKKVEATNSTLMLDPSELPDIGSHPPENDDEQPAARSNDGVSRFETEPLQTEPSQAEPSQAEPLQAEASQTEPSQTEPSQAEPLQAEPLQAEPSQTEPLQAEASQAEPSQTEPSTSPAGEEEIVVERHASVSVSPEVFETPAAIREEPRKKTPWVLLLLLPLAIGLLVFVAVRSIERPAQPKSDEALLRALLRPDRAELETLAKKSTSDRAKVLAMAHLIYRNGLAPEARLEASLSENSDLKTGEADAARATLELSRGNLTKAIEAARRAAISERPTPFARYLAGRVLASTGLPEGEALLRKALDAKPEYRDATLALATYYYLDEEQEMAQRALQTAPSDDVEAIIPLYRSAVETPTDPETRTATDNDLIKSYGASSHLLRTFLQEKVTKLKDILETSTVRDPLNLGLIASVALARGAPGPALEAALLAQSLVPQHPGIRRIVAKSAFALNDPTAAWTALSGYSEHDEESLVMLARTAMQTSNEKYMRDALTRIDARAPNVELRLQALAIELQTALASEKEQRIGLLREAKLLSAENPGNVSALYALVAAAKASADIAAQQKGLEELVRAAPQSADAHLLYGQYWQSQGNFEKAETGLSQALSLDPGERRAAKLLGELLITHGHYGRAELHYRSDLPSGIDATIGRTQALAASGRNIDGLAELEKALAHEKLSPAQRLKLASAALALSRPDHAEELVNELASESEAEADAIVLLAKALSAQGKAEEATEQLERALELAPDSSAALLAKSEAAVHAGKPATAHKYLALASPKIEDETTPEPVKAQYWLLKGRAHLLEGASELDKAREALRKAVALRGTMPEAYFFLGESLASANSPQATKAYADYVALAPNGPYRKRAERALGDRK